MSCQCGCNCGRVYKVLFVALGLAFLTLFVYSGAVLDLKHSVKELQSRVLCLETR